MKRSCPNQPNLKVLQSRHRLSHIGILAEDAESQNEDWVLRVDGLEAVIAAFVDVDDVFTELRGLHSRCLDQIRDAHKLCAEERLGPLSKAT